MDLRGLIAVLRKWFPLVLTSVLLASAMAYLISGLLPRVFEARTTLLVGPSVSSGDTDVNELEVARRLSQTYAEVATTRPLLERVIASQGLPISVHELRRQVRADAPRDSTLLRVTAQDRDPSRAAAIADGVAAELTKAGSQPGDLALSVQRDIEVVQRNVAEVQAEIDSLTARSVRTPIQERRLETLQERLVSLLSSYSALLSFSSSSSGGTLTVIEPAAVPSSPVSPNVLSNTLLAAALGLLLGIGIAFLVEYLDDTVKTAEDVQTVAHIPTLGLIGQAGQGGRSERKRRLVTLDEPRSAAAESFRTLRTNIEFLNVDSALRALLVSSALPGEGKTTVAANLAVAFAQAGRKTLLVDADLRLPGVDLLFDLPNTYGLTSLLLSDEYAIEEIAHQTVEKNLRVITAGPLPPNPSELFASKRMQLILDRLTAYGELVIFDSPSIQAVTDAAIIASVADGTLLVIDAGRTRHAALRGLLETLTRANARVLGAALNRVALGGRAASYYYGRLALRRDWRAEPAADHDLRSS